MNPDDYRLHIELNENKVSSINESNERSIYLSWNSLSVKVMNNILFKCQKNRKQKNILYNADGLVKPGEMLALMGASGSGKTTLLNVLNFRSASNLKIEGDIMINGMPANSKKISKVSSYIEQDYLFFGTLTVKEHLEFHAMLRMKRSVTFKKKRERVNEVLNEFNLEICKNTKIGIPGNIKGISGGQKRRLAFATEILTDPSVLFCDEPTSGLDGYMAKSIIKCLQKMAANGKTIICTIHQPSSEIFSLFNTVCLLSEGKVAYFGDRMNAVEYFDRNLNLQIPEYTNPADFYIDSLGVDMMNENESKLKMKKYSEIFKASNENMKLVGYIESIRKRKFSLLPNKKPYEALWILQLILLLKRSFTNYFRNYKLVINDFLMSIVTAILGGIIYYQLADYDNGSCTFSQRNKNNISIAAFYAVAVMTLINVLAAALTFPLELPIFFHEHRALVYRCDTYYLSKFLSEIPIYLAYSIIFSTIIYYMVSFGCEPKNYGYFLIFLVLIAQSSLSLGHVVSIIAADVNMAISLAAPILAIQMLFSGFFLNTVDKVSQYIINLKYLSIFNYGYNLLMINQWKNTNLTCESPNFQQCSFRGEDVLTSLNLKIDDLEFNIGMMVVLIIGFRLFAFIILLIKSFTFKICYCNKNKKNKKLNNGLIIKEKSIVVEIKNNQAEYHSKL